VTADVDCFGLTHQGKVRRRNDDHFLIASLHKLMKVLQTSLPEPGAMPLVSETRGFLFMVADGVGGRPHGDVASGTALRFIAQYVTHLMDLYNRLDPERETQFLTELEKSVQRSHEILVAEAERSGDGRGGATTLTMVAAVWPRAYLVQVGDSRCYRLRDGTLERMSQDQTMAQALVERGALSPADAEHSPLRNMLASALGGSEARPMTASTDIRWDDVMLLCTDGLTKHVSESEIEAELAANAAAEASCRRLVDRALERGGTDNVTVLISRLRPRRPSVG
jgi:protein phosphatase